MSGVAGPRWDSFVRLHPLRALPRWGTVWLVLVLVGAAVELVVLAAQNPGSLPWGLGLLGLLGVVLWWMSGSVARLRPAASGRPPALVHRRRPLPPSPLELTEGTTVEAAVLRTLFDRRYQLVASRSGVVARVDLAVVAGSRGVSRTPDELRFLADAAAAPGVRGGKAMGAVLRQQADHIAAGGDVAGSPLARAVGTP